MNRKQWLIGIVLADFVALNAYVVYHYGYLGFVQAALSNLAGIAVMVDLAIAVSLIAVWMWTDARRRGLNPAPYLVLSLFLGSVGPLAYLLRIAGRRADEPLATPLSVAAR